MSAKRKIAIASVHKAAAIAAAEHGVSSPSLFTSRRTRMICMARWAMVRRLQEMHPGARVHALANATGLDPKSVRHILRHDMPYRGRRVRELEIEA